LPEIEAGRSTRRQAVGDGHVEPQIVAMERAAAGR